MKAFNFKKMAKSEDYTITEKSIEENRESMNLSNEKQAVDGKNINLSLPTKDKDNTVPYEKQLEAARSNKNKDTIIEKEMSNKIVSFGEKTEGVSPINAKSEELDNKKVEEYKKAEKNSKNDTKFWDKYVGVQLEGKKTTVDNNIPSNASQLQNNPERFKGKIIEKMVMAAIKDADSMLFHIYASCAKDGRELNEKERQQIIDITAGKLRILSENKLGYVQYPTQNAQDDPVIKVDDDGVIRVYEQDGTLIDEFDSVEEGRNHYPEADIVKGDRR